MEAPFDERALEFGCNVEHAELAAGIVESPFCGLAEVHGMSATRVRSVPLAGAPRKRKTNRREVARGFRVGSGSGHIRHLRQVSTKLCLDKLVSEVYISK